MGLQLGDGDSLQRHSIQPSNSCRLMHCFAGWGVQGIPLGCHLGMGRFAGVTVAELVELRGFGS